MSSITLTKEQLRLFLYYEYKNGLSCPQAIKKLGSVFGAEQFSKRTCYNWYRKFKSGDESLKHKPKSGRPSNFDEVALINLIHKDSSLSYRQLAKKLNSTNTTVCAHMKKLGLARKQANPSKISDYVI